MKIAVIGAGFTGLSAAYELSKKKHTVIVFEKDSNPGGLAVGYKENNWQWSLEKYYHHWFTNDKSILNLANKINYKIITKRPKTSVYIKNKIFQLDSPITVLKFPLLSVINRLRMGFILGFLKYFPFWKILEKIKTTEFLKNAMGEKAYELIWMPQLINKFGNFFEDISLSWFWARIRKRTSSLSYPAGGFLNFANAIIKEIINNNGALLLNTSVIKVDNKKELSLTFKNSKGKTQTEVFDKIIFTTPSFALQKICELPQNYINKIQKLNSLGAINLVLRLKKPFFNENTYWLSVCDINSPIMAIVEHTKFMDKKYYNNEHIVYLGNYKPIDDIYFSMDKSQLLNHFDSYLNTINSNYRKNLISYEIFKSFFAQPIIYTNYSKFILPFETPIKNVYLANMEQVYPWDRGTNYAVEIGAKIAKLSTE